MRLFVALVLVVAILGAVQGFVVFQQSVARQSTPTALPSAPEATTAKLQLHARLNFDAAPEPFQLFPAAITLRRAGAMDDVARHPDPMVADQEVTLTVDSSALISGDNSIIVEVALDRSGTPTRAIDQSNATNLPSGDGKVQTSATASQPDGSTATQSKKLPATSERMADLRWTTLEGTTVAEQQVSLQGDDDFVIGRFQVQLP